MVVLLGFLFASGVWAQSEMAQCHPGYEWVCVQSGSSDASQGGVTAQCPDRLLSGSHRIGILWTRILARLVPCWMHRVAVSVSRLAMEVFPIVSEDFCLFPATYNYPPVNSSESYRPPRMEHPDDQNCDCNTVMYKYEVQTPQRGLCADLPFGLESLHGLCHVSGRLDLLVRPRTAAPLRYLLTTPSRFGGWLPICREIYVSE